MFFWQNWFKIIAIISIYKQLTKILTARTFVFKLKSNQVRDCVINWKRMYNKSILEYSKYPTNRSKRTKINIKLALKKFCILK